MVGGGMMKIVLRVAGYVLGEDECGREKNGRMAFFVPG